ncbi:erythromycin esterase family protein [Paenibacillus sp. GSMTC-2017]|uniref:erythromycin esterase family protein n=1 Tax=Paenibacillus sp. GSMTC-2017 TaxID=2794350 RepID=UPI0018DA0C51|nr:erythromycin esterase family protein [Paenibacillus sp. GSMTC-2017]MBH5319548.1 erythromycin esterase family protein [Paenibacillus sp. GSMTC-2017]
MKPTLGKLIKFSAVCAIVSSICLAPAQIYATKHTTPTAPATTQQVSVKATSIKSIDVKANDKFEDLQFLKKVLADKRVVMLGESSHGAAEFNKSKVRLSQFLHKEMGFNVIAFESGLGDASGTYAEISKLTPEESLRKSIYPVWHTKEMIPLYTYIKQQSEAKKPLILTGFDMQPNNGYGRFMKTWFEPIDTSFAEKARTLEGKLTDIYFNMDWDKANWDKDYADLLVGYTEIQTFLNKHQVALQAAFPGNKTIMPIMNRVIEDRIYMIQNVLKHQVAYNNLTMENYVVSTNLRENMAYLRDEMMASTLTWLIDNIYKDEKIIVWGHNYHIRKNNSSIESLVQIHPYAGGSVPNMTELMPSRIKKQTYVIGQFMYEGETAGNDGTPMPVNSKHSPTSLEAILKKSGYPYSFVDLTIQHNKSWKDSIRNGMYWGLIEEPFVPSEQYDGILFIQKTSAVEYLTFK